MKRQHINYFLSLGLLMCSFTLLGCNQKTTKTEPNATQKNGYKLPAYPSLEGVDSKLAEAQNKAVRGIAKAAPKETSWDGFWAVTVLNKDRQLLPGNFILKANKPGDEKIGEEVPASNLKADEVIYMGYLKVGKEGGYEVVTNLNNSVETMSDFQVTPNNQLKWFYESPIGAIAEGGVKKRDTLGNKIIKLVTASYDPSTDTLYGKVRTVYQLAPIKKQKGVYVMKKNAEGKNQFTFNGNQKKIYVEAATYTWKGVRISAKDFEALAKPGLENTTKLPQYVVGLNLDNAKIAEQLDGGEEVLPEPSPIYIPYKNKRERLQTPSATQSNNGLVF